MEKSVLLKKMPSYTLEDWKSLLFKPQRRAHIQKVKTGRIIGYDTETVPSKGNIFLIACSDKRTLFYPNSFLPDEENGSECLLEILKFLTQKEYRGIWGSLYNLDFDFGGIIKLLPYKLIKEIADGEIVHYHDYSIRWIPRKAIMIKSPSRYLYQFFDTAQFYDFMSLESASEKYLQKKKVEIDPAKFESLEYREKRRSKIEEYCIHDALLTKELMEYILKVFEECGIKYNLPFSRGAIAECHFLNSCKIPKFAETPRNIQEAFFLSYSGGRFEFGYRRHHQEKIYIYDINSAYPFATSLLPQLSKMRWKKSKEIDPYADIAVYNLIFTPDNEWLYQPIPIKEKGIIVYPKRKIQAWICKPEAELLSSFGKIKIIEGFEGYASDPERPFRNEIISRYQQRQRLKEDGNKLEYGIKVTLNALYGKFLQRINNQTGMLFNPIYASTITSTTRSTLLNTVIDFDDSILGFATDSIISLKPLPLPVSNKIGEFSLTTGDEIIILGNGIYTTRIYNKESSTLITVKNRHRGMITTLDLFEICDTAPDSPSCPVTYRRPLKIKECLPGVSKSVERIGAFVEEIRYENVNMDRKRLWHTSLNTFKELLLPLECSSPLP